MKAKQRNIDLKKFGDRLKNIRKLKGISQRNLAYKCEVEISQISRIERGIIATSINMIYELARQLNVSAKDFFD